MATSYNFGLLGNDRIHILYLPPFLSSPFIELAPYNTADSVYDLSWFTSNDFLPIVAIVESRKIYYLSFPPTSNPINLSRSTLARYSMWDDSSLNRKSEREMK